MEEIMLPLMYELPELENEGVEYVLDERAILSRSKNTPFEGARFSGKVLQTLVAGRTVYTH
jgi:dihydroorotase